MVESLPIAQAPSISAELAGAAGAHGDTPIIVHSAVRPAETTVGELWADACRVAAHWRELGVRAGEVVAVQLPNWRECFVVHAAAWACGAVLLPIVPIYGPREVESILRRSAARVFVTASSWRGREAAEVFASLVDLPALEYRFTVGDPVPGIADFAALATGDPAGFAPYVPRDPDEICLLVYTSGTTSEPKGVRHSHASLLGELRAMERLRGNGPDLRSLVAFPPGHVAGTLGVLRMLGGGALTVAMDVWSPEAAAELIATHRIQVSSGAPIHLAGVLDIAEERGLDLSCLSEYTTGAANVSGDLIRRAQRFGVRAFRCYGSTEHPTISSGVPDDPLDKRAETDGRPTPGSRIRIVDDSGAEVPVGQDGEILSQGPELFVGYTDAEANESAFTGGWFRTGDIGSLDAEGYLRITDRKKDIIIRGGENISSKEVEDVLLAHPGIVEAAAIGIPDIRYGERVCAVVVLRNGYEMDLAALSGHFRESGLARQKTPEYLRIVDALPRTASGKVQKPQLRSQFAGELQARAGNPGPNGRGDSGSAPDRPPRG